MAFKFKEKIRKAFTLVEIAVTLAVTGVLLAAFVPSYAYIQGQAMLITTYDQMRASYNAIQIQDVLDGSFEYNNGVLIAKSVNSNKIYYSLVENGRVMDAEVFTDKAKNEYTANAFYSVEKCPNNNTALVTESGEICIYMDPNVVNNDTAEGHISTTQAAHVVFDEENVLDKLGRGGVLSDISITQTQEKGVSFTVKFISTGNVIADKVVFDQVPPDKNAAPLAPTPSEEQPEPTHEYVYELSIQATCTSAGESKGKCIYCGDRIDRVDEALGHDLTHFEYLDSTCVDKGHNEYDRCERPGCTYNTMIEFAPKGHDYVNHAKVEPTCTESGMEAYKSCTRCDYETEHDVIPALGHNYRVNVTAPTCTAEGYTRHKCTRCPYYYDDTTTAALGHDWKTTYTVKETCTSDGYQNQRCSRCGNTQTITLPKLGGTHNYVYDGSYSGDCMTEGCDYYECTRCQHSYGVNTGYGSHKSKSVTAVSPTCTESGSAAGTVCSICGEILSGCESVPATGHTPGDLWTYSEPTCTEGGLQLRNCTVCGEVLPGVESSALGHNWDSGTVVTPATCSSSGVKKFTCTRCGQTQNEAYKGGAHSFSPYEVPATCTTDGYSSLKCTLCHYETAKATIPATGHDYGEGVWETYRDTGTNPYKGTMTYTCKVCGFKNIQFIYKTDFSTPTP